MNIPLLHITATAPSGKTRLIQFGPFGARVVTSYDNTGKFAEITANQPPYYTSRFPAGMCGLAAGKDSWMRDIAFKCDECGERQPAHVLHGSSDLPGHCEKCATKYFTCSICGGFHHPDDGCQTFPNKYTTLAVEGGAK